MKIKSIALKNFFCYFGELPPIEFREGLNLILGANGYGKSKLYEAFQWIFTNGISSSDSRLTHALELTTTLKRQIISEKALAEAPAGTSVECGVTLIVEHGRFEYKLIRTYCTQKKADGTWKDDDNSKLMIYKMDVIKYEPVFEGQHESLLNTLLPIDVRPYLWFRGERGVSNLIDTSSEESFKNVVRKLSNVSQWDTFIGIAEKAADTARKQFNDDLKNVRKNADKIATQQERRKTLSSALSKLNEQIDMCQTNLQAARDSNAEKIIQYENAKNLKTLQQEQEILYKERSSLEKEINGNYQRFNSRLFSEYWLLMGSQDLIRDFESIYSDYAATVAARQRQSSDTIKLPKGIPEPIHIREMLRLKHCTICDRPALEGTKEYKAIESRLPDEEKNAPQVKEIAFPMVKEIYTSVLGVQGYMDNADESIKDAMGLIQSKLKRMKDVENLIQSKDQELAEQLRISGVDNPQSVIDSVKTSTADIELYSTQLGRHEEQRESRLKELKAVDEMLDFLSEGEVDPVLKMKKELLEDLHELTIRLKKTKYRELVNQLEDEANHHYERINKPTGAFYGRIKFMEITEGGFRPVIIDPVLGDKDVTSTVNTSLIGSMKLAIIMAIITANKLMGYATAYPLIADAPVSEFDAVKTKAFLKEVSATYSQSIVIIKELLVPDPKREERFAPDTQHLQDLEEQMRNDGKSLTVYQIDIPDGISSKSRNQIEVAINPL